MIFKQKYTLRKWTEWDSFISMSINDFIDRYSFCPIIIEANEHTFSQFDFLVNIIPNEKSKLRDEYMKTVPTKDENVCLGSFGNGKCSVTFAMNNSLKDKEISLIYDDDPDWEDDGSTMEIPPNEDEMVFATRTDSK